MTRSFRHSVWVAAFVALTATATHASPITLSIPIAGIFISDGGPGDLDPADGVIHFRERVDDSAAHGGHGNGIRDFDGRAIYVPGVAYTSGGGFPGQTGFGVILTDFTMTSIEAPTNLVPPCYLGQEFGSDPLCTDAGRPITTFGQMDLFVQGQFSPGIAFDDFGVLGTGLNGSVTTDAARVFVSDLGTWAGSPAVSSGHIVPIVNPNAPVLTTVPFNFGVIVSPRASGQLGTEFVTYQLLTYYIPPNNLGKLQLPDSGSAIVQAAPVPEPSTMLLCLTGGVVALRRRARKRSGCIRRSSIHVAL